mmetsp:Transcript_7217/g.22766  ORF Transcript_7217/g.22766 Transcript_7217/m.22766 type:complete len:236 (-) Transcript_7217:253-960(-)
MSGITSAPRAVVRPARASPIRPDGRSAVPITAGQKAEISSVQSARCTRVSPFERSSRVYSPTEHHAGKKKASLIRRRSRSSFGRSDVSPAARSRVHHVTMITFPPGRQTRASSETNAALSGMCSPDSSDQTRSNCPREKGSASASATRKRTRSPKPCAVASALARAACFGLSVTPVASQPYLRARWRLEPPIPQPTSSTERGGREPGVPTPAQLSTASIMSTCACLWSLRAPPLG